VAQFWLRFSALGGVYMSDNSVRIVAVAERFKTESGSKSLSSVRLIFLLTKVNYRVGY